MNTVYVATFFLIVCSSINSRAMSTSNNNPLIKAVEKNDLIYVKKLIDAGANIETRSEDKSTPLIIAACKGYT